VDVLLNTLENGVGAVRQLFDLNGGPQARRELPAT